MDRASHIRTRIVEAGVLADLILRQPRQGRIAAVFDRSLYAVFGEEWICIGSEAIGSGPLHVLCEAMAPGWFSLGQDIIVTDAALLTCDIRLTGLDAAPVWSPRPAPDWTRRTLQAGILAVDDVWRAGAMREGLAALGDLQPPLAPTPVVEAALPGAAALRRLIEAELRGYKPADAGEGEIVALIGLGPGLTPSGDDFLAGALLALASLGLSDMRDKLWNILSAHLGRTNDISAAHLRSAAAGYGAGALHAAIDAAICGRADRIVPALAAVSRIGHSSGRDAFAGALAVLRAVDSFAACTGPTQHPAVAA